MSHEEDGDEEGLVVQEEWVRVAAFLNVFVAAWLKGKHCTQYDGDQ